MRSLNTDYVTIYFEFLTLMKIHDKPAYETLRELKNHLIENDSVVTSDLGAGINGQLGLVFTKVMYANVNPTAYA